MLDHSSFRARGANLQRAAITGLKRSCLLRQAIAPSVFEFEGLDNGRGFLAHHQERTISPAMFVDHARYLPIDLDPIAWVTSKDLLHTMPGRKARQDLTTFLETISLLGDKLGPLLVQLPPTFGYHNLDALEGFLRHLRELAEESRFAIEFRNASLVREDVVSILREHNVALCLSDLDWMPFPVEPTTDFAYFRWLGHSSPKHNSSPEPRDLTQHLIASVMRMRHIAYQVEEVYGFFNDRYGGHAPEIANLLKEMLGLPHTETRSLWPPQLSVFGE